MFLFFLALAIIIPLSLSLGLFWESGYTRSPFFFTLRLVLGRALKEPKGSCCNTKKKVDLLIHIKWESCRLLKLLLWNPGWPWVCFVRQQLTLNWVAPCYSLVTALIRVYNFFLIWNLFIGPPTNSNHPLKFPKKLLKISK